jgi:hypothetical protein
VIVGRAFHEAIPEPPGRAPEKREAALALSALLAATLVALVVLHLLFTA